MSQDAQVSAALDSVVGGPIIDTIKEKAAELLSAALAKLVEALKGALENIDWSAVVKQVIAILVAKFVPVLPTV